MRIRSFTAALMMGAAVAAAPLVAGASSHREAPFILETPRVDGTDFYMFRSYEPGRENFVTFISNWIPLQPPYGGPNFFSFDSDAVYEIKIDNDGDACEDLSFQFRFSETLGNNGQGVTIPVGPAGNQVQVEIPLINKGRVSIADADQVNINFFQSYTINTFRRDNCRGRGTTAPVTNAAGNSSVFRRPLDYVGTTSFGSPVSTTAQVSALAYETYARNFINNINIPNCGTQGKVFVGQRKEPFYVDLGDVFDLLSFSSLTGVEPALTTAAFTPVGENMAGLGPNVTGDFNITTIALEVPIACLVGSPDDPVIGAWMTSSLPTTLRYQPAARIGAFSPQIARGRLTQTSRLGMPLVNELVIGLPFKNLFNNSQPKDDTQFAKFVTNPTVPELVEIVFGGAVEAPNLFPRTDLITAFLRGLPGLNAPANAFTGTTPNPDFVLAEMLRLNTSIAETDRGDQSRLGALGDDNAGFPNGRRPGDDVADIIVRVAMGALIGDPMVAPDGDTPFVDGALSNVNFVDTGMNNAAPVIELVMFAPPADAAPGARPSGCEPIMMGTVTVDYDCSHAFSARFPYLTTPFGGDLQP